MIQGEGEGGPRLGSAAILAGGAGKRLGGLDKEAIQGPQGPLGPALALRLAASFEEVLVVTKRPGFYEGLGPRIRAIGDELPGFGPLSGLHAALRKARSELLYLSACDMPAFDPAYARFLFARREEALRSSAPAPLALLSRLGPHLEPFHALYSRALLPRLEALLRVPRDGTERQPSFRDLLAGVAGLYIPEEEARRFSPDWGLFRNINTPEELERFLRGD